MKYVDIIKTGNAMYTGVGGGTVGHSMRYIGR